MLEHLFGQVGQNRSKGANHDVQGLGQGRLARAPFRAVRALAVEPGREQTRQVTPRTPALSRAEPVLTVAVPKDLTIFEFKNKILSFNFFLIASVALDSFQRRSCEVSNSGFQITAALKAN